MRTLALALSLAFVATASLPASGGIIIGNPPSARWTFAAEASGTTSLRANIEAIELYGCAPEADTWVDLAGEVDFVEGFTAELPEGDWCAVSIVLAGPLTRCTATGCITESPAYLDLESESDIELRGIIIGNPPLRAVRTP